MNPVDDIYVTGVGITVTYKGDGAPAVADMAEVGVTFTLRGRFPEFRLVITVHPVGQVVVLVGRLADVQGRARIS